MFRCCISWELSKVWTDFANNLIDIEMSRLSENTVESVVIFDPSQKYNSINIRKTSQVFFETLSIKDKQIITIMFWAIKVYNVIMSRILHFRIIWWPVIVPFFRVNDNSFMKGEVKWSSGIYLSIGPRRSLKP